MQRENIKVVFMGTPDFAEESLRELYEAGFNIIGVLTNPDKPSGRGMKLKASPVKEYALSKNIPVYQPKKVRNNEEILNTLKELAPDVGKFMLQNDYNWNEKQKIEIDKLFEGIKFVGLK